MSERDLKYKFFTPYPRGFGLVFDYLVSQPKAMFHREPWCIKARYGYKNSRDTTVFADGQIVGDAHRINERFARIVEPYRQFMLEVETAATEWQSLKEAAQAEGAARRHREDDELCDRILRGLSRISEGVKS